MKKIALILFTCSLIACGKKPQEAAATVTDTTQVAVTPTTSTSKKTLKDYFEAYKQKEISPKDTVIIHQQSENQMLIEHSPLNSEVAGTIFVSVVLVTNEAQTKDYLVTYYHSSVEGYCNVGLENLKIYSSDLEDITNKVIDTQYLKTTYETALKKAQKKTPKEKLDGFYASFEEGSGTIRLGLVSSSDEKLMTHSTLNEVTPIYFGELYWNSTEEKYVKDYPHAG